MISLNRAQILGNLTRDPEIRMTPNGQQVAGFSIATNRRWTSPSGEQQDSVEYHEIVAWGKLAEVAQKMLSKGKPAFVEGRLQTRTWEAPDGAKKQKTEIIAESIIALGSGRSTDEGFLGSSEEKTEIKSTSKKQKSEPSEDEIDLDSIPF